MAVGAEGFDRAERLRLAAGAAVLFALLGILTATVWHVDGPTALDHTPLGINAHLDRVGPSLFRALVAFGSPGVVAVSAVAVAALASAWRDWFGATLGVVHLGWHYATDAAGGIALGGGVVLAAAAALSAVWPGRRPATR